MCSKVLSILFVLTVLFCGMGFNLSAQGTAFTYQGRLADGGTAANGTYDFQFSLYNAATNGALVSGPVTSFSVPVNGGLFTTNIDFGGVLTGTNYWLAIAVRTNGSASGFTTLQPLQFLLPVPYAVFANSASSLLGNLPATQLSGTVSSAVISGAYSGGVIFNNSTNSFSGAFSGNGAGLANLNGSQITSGTVADARLTTNVALLNGTQTFGGVNSFTNRSNTFIGNFFGNGLVGWIPVSVTSTQAMANAGYLLLSSNLTTVTLPPTNALLVGDIVRISGGGAGGWLVAQNTNESILGNFSGYSQTSWLPSSVGTGNWISLASSASGGLMAAVASASGAIYISKDYGFSWSQSSPGNTVFRCVASSADGSRLIAGQASSGTFYYSTNYGGTWTAGTSASANWYSIAMSSSGLNAVAVSNPGGIYTSANGGATWQLQSSGLPASANWFGAASSAGASTLVAVNYAGGVYISTNAGANWTSQTVGSGGLSWRSVTSSADGTKFAAAAYGGGIYTSVNSGLSWQASGAPVANYEGVVSSSDGSRLAAVVDPGSIYTSINFGSNWNTSSVPSSVWSSICGSADGSHLTAGVYGGNIYYTSSSALTSTTVGTNGYLSGPQFSALELQYLGKGQFMPISSSGTFWAN